MHSIDIKEYKKVHPVEYQRGYLYTLAGSPPIVDMKKDPEICLFMVKHKRRHITNPNIFAGEVITIENNINVVKYRLICQDLKDESSIPPTEDSLHV